jgi:hypothetical protein
MNDKSETEKSSISSAVITLFQDVKNYFEQPKKINTDKLPSNLTEEKIEAEIREICSKEDGIDRIKNLFKYE